MKNQYCKVGTVTPISSKTNMVNILEYQHQNFLNKASTIDNDEKLLEFFEQKALKIKSTLESLV